MHCTDMNNVLHYSCKLTWHTVAEIEMVDKIIGNFLSVYENTRMVFKNDKIIMEKSRQLNLEN